MGLLQLVFMDAPTPVGAVIRAVTWGDWSHVGVKVGDFIIDSRWSDKGVAVVPFSVRQKQYPRMEIMILDLPASNILDFMQGQVGKPYDWTPLFGIPFHRDWQDEDKWFCSELVAAACVAAGRPIIHKPTGRVTPQNLYEVAGALQVR